MGFTMGRIKTSAPTVKKFGFADDDRPKDKQINKIIAIAKYKFGWKRKAIFNYILDSVKDCGLRVSVQDAKNYKYSTLLQTLSVSEKSKVIQRLEQIEKRNNGAANVKLSEGSKTLGRMMAEAVGGKAYADKLEADCNKTQEA